MGVRRNPLGPLHYASLRRIGETTFWEQTRPPDIDPEDTDRAHTVRIADRIDNLAVAYLGSQHLWWVIMLRNGISLTPNGLVPGTKIFIPTRESLSRRGII
ncbi:MAG: hypothetical protein AB7L09_00310 [Nitrospira sp.]